MNRLSIQFTFLCIFFLLMGCYKEEHWGFPGPYEEETVLPDSLPFPFDKDRQAGVWLMKDGNAMDDKILFKGFTDFYAAGDTLSWIKESNGMRLIQHRNPYPVTNADHVGGRENSYRNNWVVSKTFLPVGKGHRFYMYFKASVGTFNGTAAGIVLGNSWENGKEFIFGFDGFSNIAPQFFLDLYERTFTVNPEAGWPTVNEVITPGIPAEFETVIVDNLFYIKVNGVLCFKMQLPDQALYYYPAAIRPWRNFLTIHDFYFEASDTFNYNQAYTQKEQGYNFIQRPSLVTVNDGSILMFAEGRGAYDNSVMRVAQTSRAIGDVDIILKTSTDGGLTWSKEKQIVAGESNNVTYANPQVVKAKNGDVILHYNKIGYLLSGTTYNLDPTQLRIYQRVSKDNGKSWSAEQDITSQIKLTNIGVQHVSGHGITMKNTSQSGRLLMPIQLDNNQAGVAYSDDQGQVWKVSMLSGTNLRSPSIVELNDGRLMMLLSHTAVTPKNKLVAYSSDAGVTWTKPATFSNGLVTGEFGHTFPAAFVSNSDGKLFCITPQNRASDPRTYGMSPVFANTPILYTSENFGAEFNKIGPLVEHLTHNNYVVPVGNIDAVVLNNGKLLIASDGGVSTPYESIVTYIK